MASKYEKCADGRYRIQVFIGFDDKGWPEYKNVYAHTIKAVEERAARVKDELEKGILIVNEKLTVEEWSWRWLELYKTDVEFYTRKMYETMIKTYIVPNIGSYRLKDLKAQHIKALITSVHAGGNPRIAETLGFTLLQILEQAVKDDHIHKNVMANISINRLRKPAERALTDEEISYVRNAVMPLREKTFIIILLTTGLCRGEALALMRKDIDLQNRIISIDKSVFVRANKMEIRNYQSSKDGIRTIPVTDELFGYLETYIPTLENEYLFTIGDNELLTDAAFRRMWQNILDAMNIYAGGTIGEDGVNKIAGDITHHVLRNTYAATLYKTGVDIETAKYLLGNISMQLLKDIYEE